MPEFSYQKGQLWRSEFMALELLSKQNLNVDKTLSIQFKARKDQRDIRPLTYKGRIAFGGIVSENAWLFRSSILAREGRTQPVEQLAGSEMAVVEDTDSSALPPSADVEAVTGAKKFEQLGRLRTRPCWMLQSRACRWMVGPALLWWTLTWAPVMLSMLGSIAGKHGQSQLDMLGSLMIEWRKNGSQSALPRSWPKCIWMKTFRFQAFKRCPPNCQQTW